jgi:hypothetical protein
VFPSRLGIRGILIVRAMVNHAGSELGCMASYIGSVRKLWVPARDSNSVKI